MRIKVTWTGISLVLICMLGVSSCANLPGTMNQAKQAQSHEFAPAPLPQYRAGTKYVYSNGTWERVLQSEPEKVTWVNHRDSVSVGSPDFTYKRSEWQTRKRKGYRRFQPTEYLFDEATDSLWPLQVGKTNRYDEFGQWFTEAGAERSYDSFWRCHVAGFERISVAAGQFDTWKITCARYPDSFRYPKARAREYRTWYYAPSVQHWIVQDRDYNGYRQNRSMELVAILPDLAAYGMSDPAKEAVKKQFQNVLEFNPRGTADIWAASKNRLVVSMTPGQSYRHPSGILCRQYQQRFISSGETSIYFGVACRDQTGSWSVPRR